MRLSTLSQGCHYSGCFALKNALNSTLQYLIFPSTVPVSQFKYILIFKMFELVQIEVLFLCVRCDIFCHSPITIRLTLALLFSSPQNAQEDFSISGYCRFRCLASETKSLNLPVKPIHKVYTYNREAKRKKFLVFLLVRYSSSFVLSFSLLFYRRIRRIRICFWLVHSIKTTATAGGFRNNVYDSFGKSSCTRRWQKKNKIKKNCQA